MHFDIIQNGSIIGCGTVHDWEVVFKSGGKRWRIEFLDRMCGGPTFIRINGEGDELDYESCPMPCENRRRNILWDIFEKHLKRYRKLNRQGRGRRGADAERRRIAWENR